MALLYERICAHVLEQLRRGALRPGDRVPSEMELAAQFDVSRITSKRALEVLREAGLVERVRGKGTFVVRRLPDLTDLTVPLRQTPRHEARSLALIVPSMSEAFGL
ncbi:MAG: GntR family transcriptional regulator, partial [Kribbellaceae bacterium]|nr:GntR family transcriptional regulator [Kribbellaceae bacterium]